MILALDSSTENGAAVLVDGGRVVREVDFAGGRARAGGGAAGALREFSDQPVGCVIVGTGPGSYNGIRSSVAAAWGFALGRGIPLHAASSLLALAPGEYLAIGDARQDRFYFAHVRDQDFVVEPMLVTRGVLLQKLDTHPDLPALTPTGGARVPSGARPAFPNPVLLAGLAGGEPVPAGEIPRPIYLKPPHITPPRPARQV